MEKLSINNIMGGGSLGEELDLSSIAKSDWDDFNTQYDPENFASVVLRHKNKKPTIMLFRSGKFSIAGGNSVRETKNCFNLFSSAIQDITGLKMSPNLEIRYFVTTGDLERSVNLSAVMAVLGIEEIEYEPEQFPGLFYRPKSENWFMIIFSSGSVVINGPPSIEKLESAYNKVNELLLENDI